MKRKCGTCRFFEDRGVAGSGVCQHVQRRELRDVVLVRQTELACRNSWDQDLWEESPNPVLIPALTGVDTEERDVLFDSKPANMKVPSNRTSHEFDGHTDSDDGGTDPVHDSETKVQTSRRTGLSRPFSGTMRNDLDEPDEDVSALRRSSVHDARRRLDEERRRARQQEQESQISEIGRRMSSPDAVGAVESDLAPRGYAKRADDKPREIPIAGLHEFPDAPPATQLLQKRVQVDESRRDDVHSPGESLSRREGMPRGKQETEQLPTHQVWQSLRQEVGQLSPADHGRQATLPVPTSPEPFVHVDGGVPRDAPTHDVGGPKNGISMPDADDPVDRAERLAALPRCCGTCRDFRQVGDGERGQCVNPYAFSDRRMVKSDQLACRSSLGTWWMPNDDVWLERADTSHHGRPTPLLDAAVRAMRSGDDGRDSHA